MQILFIKDTDKYAQLTCIRHDGSTTSTNMPEQGIAPHDLIHFVVEKSFNISGAFYGQLKAGANINFKLEHNELSREIACKTEIWQTESMVEALQSLLWSGAKVDFEAFMYMTEQACTSRGIPSPTLTEAQFNSMQIELLKLNQQWKTLTKGQQLSVTF